MINKKMSAKRSRKRKKKRTTCFFCFEFAEQGFRERNNEKNVNE